MKVTARNILRAIRDYLKKHDINVPPPTGQTIEGQGLDRKISLTLNDDGQKLIVGGYKKMYDLCNDDSWVGLGIRILPLADPELLDNVVTTIRHIIDGRRL